MNILVLCYEYPPIGGGGGVGAQQYAECWARLGHSVTVLTSHGPDVPQRETRNGVDLIRVKTLARNKRATTSVATMMGYNVCGAAYIRKHRQEFSRFDVINTHFAMPTGLLGRHAARVMQRPHVLTIIGGDIYDPSKWMSPHRHATLRYVNRSLMRSADSVVAISSDTARRARELYGVERDIRVINYGYEPIGEVPPLQEDAPPDNPRGMQLVAVGRLIRRKRFDILIRALRLLPEDVRLWLIGDGPLQEDLSDLAEQLGVRSRVEFLGFQPRQKIMAYLQAANCFVLSSDHEGLGIVVQEAMEAGLPIVATNNGGQVDLIEHERNGLLVEPANAAAMSDAIRTYYWDSDLAASVGQQNEVDITQWAVDIKSRDYLDVFAEVIGEPVPAVTPEPQHDEARSTRTGA